MSRLRPTRRIAALAVAVVALAGLSLASASQLSLNGGTLQAGVGAVVDCQPAGSPIKVSLTSAYSGSGYVTTAVRMSGVNAACQGLTYRVQLVDGAGASIDLNGTSTAGTDLTGSVNLVSSAFSVTIPSTPTATIARVALVITG